MEANFWHDKWARGEIAFHQQQANPFLVAHFDALHLTKGSRVFLPLCGKTRDIAWLLAQGYRVAGAELSELAIKELFQELGVAPQITQAGKLMHFSAQNLDIFVGDIFDLTAEMLGQIDAIYDRAALVALPLETRKLYAAHLMNMTGSAPQLVITYAYDQSKIDGPPFSISAEEVRQHYSAKYALISLETHDVEGGMKGKTTATETAWLLQRK